MATDPRAALDRFLAALEEHHLAVSTAQDPDSPRVEAATSTLREAFVTYDDALYRAYEIDLPLEEIDDDYDDDDDDYDDDGDEGGFLLDDEDFEDDDDDLEDDEDDDED
jgi:hypothetical protein